MNVKLANSAWRELGERISIYDREPFGLMHLVLELGQILVHSLAEIRISDVVVQHPDDRRAFRIRDGVKDLVDFRWMTNRNFDRVRVIQSVQLQSAHVIGSHELSPNVEF